MTTQTNLQALQVALDALNHALAEILLASAVAHETEGANVEQTEDPDGGLMLRVTLPSGETKILRS